MNNLVFTRYQNNIYVNKMDGGVKKPFIVNIPSVTCLESVKGSGTKFTIGIENIMKDFFEVLDSKVKDFLGETIYFKGLAKESIVRVKLPYRYKKFEVDVKTSTHLATVYDIKKGSNIDITLELKNIWTIEESEEVKGKKTGNTIILGGYLWVVKNVVILE